ncbi:unnamed protein product [Ceratitis capitata]|uniref:(Mediterranean fruit fly) hypothetical protein n=1 Tax=Ceratitis capitata TaxID=7213 RepID=A0A811UEN5_CERCA|nr:unnamed protein product [Ceratitis capitata]
MKNVILHAEKLHDIDSVTECECTLSLVAQTKKVKWVENKHMFIFVCRRESAHPFNPQLVPRATGGQTNGLTLQ